MGDPNLGVITVNFFDKMSYHGARVKIISGMVRLLIPCVYTVPGHTHGCRSLVKI